MHRVLRSSGTYKRKEQSGSLFETLKNMKGIFNKILSLTSYQFASPAYMKHKYGNKTCKGLFMDYSLRWRKIAGLMFEILRLKQ